MTTTSDIAKKYGKSSDEVKRALSSVGYEKRITITSKIDPDTERKLDAHFLGQKLSPRKAAAPPPAAVRQIGTTQITVKKTRTINRPVRPTTRAVAPAADSSVPPPAPVESAEVPAASPSPQPKPAVESEAAVAAESVPPADDLYTRQISIQQQREADIKKASARPPPTPVPEDKKTIKIDPGIVRRREQHRRQRPPGGQRLPANQHGFKQPVGQVVRELPVPENITVSRLAADMSVKTGEVIRKLMSYGLEEASTNMVLDRETAWVMVEEFGHKPVPMSEQEDPEKMLLQKEFDSAPKEPRPPVVTIMGHVDHGKTSLLDYIRKTRVASGEAGGITQHIGAYQVADSSGAITFLDTPGHALFSQMRARGAQITDIIVLVVAGDDGVKPQTQEAIAHAQAAAVPIVVAINKMDKPGADVERIKTELSNYGVLPEDWGGDAICAPVSAATGEGIEGLLDAIRTQSEILGLQAPRTIPAQGVVVEASIDKGRGVVATIVLKHGILRRGDYFVCGTESGRVRAMWNSTGDMLQEATPSMPVEIQGLSGMPDVGEDLIVMTDERKAREVAEVRQERYRLKRLSAGAAARPIARILNNSIEKTELNVIIKADVGGSREALAAALSAVSGKKAAIKVIYSAVGGVSESDINLARASGALIIAFNIRPSSKARKLAQSYGVRIMFGNVIYEIIENAEKSLLNLLDAEREEKIIGTAEVLKVFAISKTGNIAGCRVAEGIIRADVRARLVRDGVMVYEGDIDSLRHFKEQASEVRSGEECGIAIRRFNDIKVGDTIEAVLIVETPPTL